MKIYKHILKEKQSEKFNLGTRRDTVATAATARTKNTSERNSSEKRMNRSMTFDNLDCVNVDFQVLKGLENLALSSGSSCRDSFNSILFDPILSKNIDCVDDVMKFMFIGDQYVGKSFLINKLLDDTAGRDSYSHTNSFEIKKKNVNLLGKRIKLELWDTNIEIMNSEISKGN